MVRLDPEGGDSEDQPKCIIQRKTFASHRGGQGLRHPCVSALLGARTGPWYQIGVEILQSDHTQTANMTQFSRSDKDEAESQKDRRV